MCSTFDHTGLCPPSPEAATTPEVVFGLCTTSSNLLANWRKYGQHIEKAGLPIVYLLDKELSREDKFAWYSEAAASSSALVTPNPVELDPWISSGERCGWSQIMSTFSSFPRADWYALGDDDTLWIVENLLDTLTTFPSSQPFYLGSIGEPVGSPYPGYSNGSDELAVLDKFRSGRTSLTSPMAWGGAGMVLSRSLMLKLNESMYSCFLNCRHLYGGDERIATCIREATGTPMHILPGFHQLDFFDAGMLFENHPSTPVLTLHHLAREEVMGKVQNIGFNLERIKDAIQLHPYSFLQRHMCSRGRHVFHISTGFQIRWDVGKSQSKHYIFQRGNAHEGTALYRYARRSANDNTTQIVEQLLVGANSTSWAMHHGTFDCQVKSMSLRRAFLVIRLG